jgi:predicted phage tail protein
MAVKDKKVKVIIVKDPLTRKDFEVIELPYEYNKPISYYIEQLKDVNVDFLVAYNGQKVNAINDNHIVMPNDEIIITPVLQGGGHHGGGSKGGGVLGAIATIGVLVAGLAAPGLLGITSAFWGAVTTMAVTTAGLMLVNAIFPQQVPTLENPEKGMKSPTYSWDGVQTISQQGIPIPVVYGRIKVGGNVIAKRIEYIDNKQYLNMLLGLCNGKVASISDIKINNNPISFYNDVEYEVRYGTNYQDPIYYMHCIEVDNYVNRKLKYNVPVSVRTQSNDVNNIKLNFIFPTGLGHINDDGSISKRTVKFKIEYKRSDSNTWSVYSNNYEITAATKDTLRKTLKMFLHLPSNQYDVRITRISEESNSLRDLDTVILSSVVEVIDEELIYPNLALLGIRALATDQLSGSLPTVTCVVDRGYFAFDDTGVSSKLYGKPSNNPAWAVYDILTNKIYGAGIDDSRIDYNSFYEWALFCEENNLKCNVIFDTEISIWDACLKLAQIGRGILKIEGTTFSVIVDKPASPVQMFSVGNIIKDSFKETFLPQSERVNYMEVTFMNEDHDYERETFSVYTDDWYTGNDVRKSITLYGVTNFEQAYKTAMYMLNYNKYITRTIEFEADIDAIACTVGDVIKVQHDVPEWGYGGRIVYATNTYIKLDKQVPVEEGETYRIAYRLQNDTIIEKDFIATETGYIDTIYLTLADDEVPQQYDLYSFGKVNYGSKLFRITSITRSGDLKRKITAIEYNESIYTNAPRFTPTFDYSQEYKIKNLTARESYIQLPNGQIGSRVTLSWDYNGDIVKYFHIYMRDVTANGEYVYLGKTQFNSFIADYNYIYLHNYEFKVVYEDYLGNKQPLNAALSTNITILMKQAPPSDVTNFTATLSGNYIQLNWEHIPDVDLAGYQIRVGSSWETGDIIFDKISKNVAYWKPPLDGTYTFWIKAIDFFGNMSLNATSTQITVSNIKDNLNIVLEEELVNTDDFAGSLENLIFYDNGTERWLAPPFSLVDADVSDWTDQTDMITTYTGDYSDYSLFISPSYDVTDIVKASIRLQLQYDSSIRRVTDQTYPNRTDLTYPNDTDQHITSNTVIKRKYWISEDGVTWTEKDFVTVSDEEFRYIKAGFEIYSDSKYTFTKISSYDMIIDVPDKNYILKEIHIPNTGLDFDFASNNIKFLKEYFVGITTLGNYNYAVSNKTLTGFHIDLFDSAGNPVEGYVDIYLRGF